LLKVLLVLLVAAPVRGDDLGEIITADHLGQRLKTFADGRVGRNARARASSRAVPTNFSTTAGSAPPSGLVRVDRLRMSSAYSERAWPPVA
jgi:hypothetical protein